MRKGINASAALAMIAMIGDEHVIPADNTRRFWPISMPKAKTQQQLEVEAWNSRVAMTRAARKGRR